MKTLSLLIPRALWVVGALFLAGWLRRDWIAPFRLGRNRIRQPFEIGVRQLAECSVEIRWK